MHEVSGRSRPEVDYQAISVGYPEKPEKPWRARRLLRKASALAWLVHDPLSPPAVRTADERADHMICEEGWAEAGEAISQRSTPLRPSCGCARTDVAQRS